MKRDENIKNKKKNGIKKVSFFSSKQTKKENEIAKKERPKLKYQEAINKEKEIEQ